jgi:hypothetical protein
VVEHTVKDNLDAAFMAFFHKISKVVIISQTAVQLPVIRCLISMSHGFKQRTDINGIAANVLNMFNPWQQRV